MHNSMPLGIPADTTTASEDFFRTEGVYAGLGAPIAGGQTARWILREGPHYDSDIELFDELCWRLVGDGLPLWRATLHMGTLHPQIRGLGARWLRDLKVIEEYRILRGADNTDEYLHSPIRAAIEQGTPFRRRLIEDAPEYPLLSRIRAAGATDYFALALNRTFRRYPVVTWATDRPSGFSDAELASLEEINPALAAIVETRAVRRITENLLDTYLGPQAGRRVLAGQIQRAQGERLRAVIMMVDMRGFTAISDRLPGDEVIRILDDYFDAIVTPVEAHKGENSEIHGRRRSRDFSSCGRRRFLGSERAGARSRTRRARAARHHQSSSPRSRADRGQDRDRPASWRGDLRKCRRGGPARLYGHWASGEPRVPDREHDQAAVAAHTGLERFCPGLPAATRLPRLPSGARTVRTRRSIRLAGVRRQLSAGSCSFVRASNSSAMRASLSNKAPASASANSIAPIAANASRTCGPQRPISFTVGTMRLKMRLRIPSSSPTGRRS